jgi:hypothetical protein
MRNIFGGRSKSCENELASGVSDALAEMEQQRPAWAPTRWAAPQESSVCVQGVGNERGDLGMAT